MQSIKNFCRIAETEYALSTSRVNLLYYDLPKQFCDEYHSYESPRFCTILRGAKEVSVNQSERFVYRKDKFILLQPYSVVNMCMVEATHALVYEFGNDIIDMVRQQVATHLDIELSQEMDYSFFKLEQMNVRLSQLHQRVQDILKEKEANLSFLIDLTCQEIIYELLKIQGCNDILHHYQDHPINKAIQLMKSGKDNSVTISNIAEEVNMSLANFSQKFKLMTDCSPKEYITKLRMKRSKDYLSYLSVTDTAYEVGYENISHYIRLFKKEYGITPKQYQLSLSAKF